jgi:hypothetical protein
VSANRYRVEAAGGASGWVVTITDPDGRSVFERACPNERQARVLVSTVEQHIGWLSEGKFRRYYRLTESRTD